MILKSNHIDLAQRGRSTRRGTGLYAHVVDVIGQAIVDGSMAEDQVVFADQLCETLGVSRSVVREGLRALSSMGLIEARPQVGTRVLPASRWDMLNPQVVTWRGQSGQFMQQMRELREFRLGVEPVAARLAAARITDDEVNQLLRASTGMQAAADESNLYGFFSADADFHRTLLHASGNSIIAQLSDTIEAALHGRTRDTKPASEVLDAQSLSRHHDLARAVADRDPDRAEEFARLIIEETLLGFDDD